MITSKLMQGLGWADPVEWAAVLDDACNRHGIITSKRVAMFLANTGHESNGGRAIRENLNYKPSALVAQWPKYFRNILVRSDVISVTLQRTQYF